MRHNVTPHEFWSRVSPSGCWEWQGAKDKDGYGQTRTGMQRVKAHRKAWEMMNGPIPEGMKILHRCNNASCVRPDHLYPGTALDNGIDRRARNRPHRGNLALSRAEVDDIRTRYATGLVRQRDLAEEYGTTQATISRIILRKAYRFDLPPKSNAKR